MEHAPGRGLQPHLTAVREMSRGRRFAEGQAKKTKAAFLGKQVCLRRYPCLKRSGKPYQTSRNIRRCFKHPIWTHAAVVSPGLNPGKALLLRRSGKTARPCPSLPVADISCFRCPERICQGPGQPAMHKSCQSLLRLPFCCLMSEGAGQGKNDPGIQPMVKKSTAQKRTDASSRKNAEG